ncbi:MAG: hypothetical protein ALECFALPRED_010903, partial [Alectoria fallacina]
MQGVGRHTSPLAKQTSKQGTGTFRHITNPLLPTRNPTTANHPHGSPQRAPLRTPQPHLLLPLRAPPPPPPSARCRSSNPTSSTARGHKISQNNSPEKASKLEDRTQHGNSAIEGLLWEMQSTVSTLNSANVADRFANAVAELRVLDIVRESDAVGELNQAMKETGLKLKIRPPKSCHHFFTLAHLNRRLRTDVLSSHPFGLYAHIETLKPLFRSPTPLSTDHIVHLKAHTYPMRADQTAQDVAVVAALPKLHTLYMSCMMANSAADSERMGDRFWEAHTRALIGLVRERGIRG